jgi:hypothetical protein
VLNEKIEGKKQIKKMIKKNEQLKKWELNLEIKKEMK